MLICVKGKLARIRKVILSSVSLPSFSLYAWQSLPLVLPLPILLAHSLAILAQGIPLSSLGVIRSYVGHQRVA